MLEIITPHTLSTAIDLTEQITQAQIAFALVIIAGALVYLASKYGEKVNREKHGKHHHRPGKH